jgi:hypothetical protein
MADETVVVTGTQPDPNKPNAKVPKPAASVTGLEHDLVTQTDQANKDITTLKQSAEKLTTDFHSTMESLRQQAPKPPDLKPFEAPEQVNPLSAFGSAAGLLAGVASLFSRAPLTTSLNALAGGMKAIHEGNAEDYQRKYDEWQKNTDYAFKTFDAQNKAYTQLIDLAQTDYNAAVNGVNTIAKLTEDGPAQQAVAINGFAALQQIVNERDRLNMEMKRYSSQMIPYDLYNQSIDDFRKSKGRSPNAKESMELWNEVQSSTTGMADENTRQANAAMLASGVPMGQVIPGWGKSTTLGRNQAKQDAINLIMQQNPGMTAAQAGGVLAQRQITFVSGKQSSEQLTKMLGATRTAVSQLEYNINQTTKEMARLKSTNISPILNALARGEEKWTGDPAYSSLFYFMQASANEAARIMSGGQASVAQLHEGAREEAQQWVNINMTPASWEGVSQSMLSEGQNRLQNFEDAIQAQGVGNLEASGTLTPPPPAVTTYDPKIVYTDANGNSATTPDNGKTWVPVRK